MREGIKHTGFRTTHAPIQTMSFSYNVFREGFAYFSKTNCKLHLLQQHGFIVKEFRYSFLRYNFLFQFELFTVFCCKLNMDLSHEMQ